MSRKGFSALVFLICSTLPHMQACAQGTTSSPYSRYGIGELQYSALTYHKGMGGLVFAAVSDTSPYYINMLNPAASSFLRHSVFEGGVQINTTEFASFEDTSTANNTGLSYIGLGTPLGSRWGITFGLLPFSSVGYRIGDQEEIDSIGVVTYAYEGKGGINRALMGVGYKLIYSASFVLSAGINGSYFFGSLDYIGKAIFPDPPNNFSTRRQQSVVIGDIGLSSGLLARKKIKKNLLITAGISFEPSQKISARKGEIIYTYIPSIFQDIPVDTVKDTYTDPDASLKGEITLPQQFGAGFSLEKAGKWLIGAEFQTGNWSNYEAFGEKDLLSDSRRFAVGGQWMPGNNVTDKKSFFRNSCYRMGFHYLKTNLQIKDTPIDEVGIHFGMGIPLKMVKTGKYVTQSVINLSIEAGQAGTEGKTDSPLVRERFVKASVGITLNDKWFLKHKFD